jgi:hypothetical protein
MRYSKVHGHDYLLRDNNTGAIINTDKRLLNYSKNKEVVLQVNQLQENFDELKNEISEIKNLLKEILTNGT